MSLYHDENQHRLDAIHDDAADAARHAWGPISSPTHRPCPHPQGSEEAEAWWIAFYQNYAKENGK